MSVGLEAGAFDITSSDRFNALATLVREILQVMAGCAKLKPRARSRSNPTRSISIGLRPRVRPSSRPRRSPALTLSIIKFLSNSATAKTMTMAALPSLPNGL